MELPAGIGSRTVDTDRLRVHVYESGPDDGVPVVLVHGNLSTGRFYERDRAVRAGPGGGLADAYRPGLAVRLRRGQAGRDAVLSRLRRQRRRNRQPGVRGAHRGR